MTSMQRRRNIAAAVCAAMIVGLVYWAYREPVGYTVYTPGPTINVLGKNPAHKEILDITGHRIYRDDGQLRLVTVYETGVNERVSLPQALMAWIDPVADVYPHDAVYNTHETSKTVKEQSAFAMASSQDTATAAALHALGIDFSHAVKVVGVEKHTPAHGVMKSGDLILGVDGHRTSDTDALVKRVQSIRPGTRVSLRVRREGRTRTLHLVTAAAAKSGKGSHRSRIGVRIAPSFRFPFKVSVRLREDIGGPSAGMMFALSIYDTLTPGSLTHGKVVAGTGEITAKGKVGEIGGVRQKIAAAQRDGAGLFLVPSGNCAEALKADYDPDKTRLVRVHTLHDALKAIRAWTKNPGADLPSCSAGNRGGGG